MLEKYLNIALINEDLKAADKRSLIAELAALIAKACPDLNADKIGKALEERENIDSTGVEEGVAIPHAKVDCVSELTVAVGVAKRGIDFGSHDGIPTRLFFVLLAPPNAAGEHMKVLARMAKVLSMPNVKEKLLESKSPGDIYSALVEAEKGL